MALSRTLSQSMPRFQPLFSLIAVRHSSTKANPQLIEVDVDSSESTEVITVGIRKLEDAIRNIIVRRAAPDWLPFMPGYSYWVPPPSHSPSARGGHPQAASLMEVVGKLAEASASASSSSKGSGRLLAHGYLASEDEQMASSSSRGWPSSDFFIQGNLPEPLLEVEGHIQELENQSDGSHKSVEDNVKE